MFNNLKPRHLLSSDEALKPGRWYVRVIDNSGKMTGVYQYCYGSALAYAKLIMMPDTDIITIEKDDMDFQKFERTHKININHWFEVDIFNQPIKSISHA